MTTETDDAVETSAGPKDWSGGGIFFTTHPQHPRPTSCLVAADQLARALSAALPAVGLTGSPERLYREADHMTATGTISEASLREWLERACGRTISDDEVGVASEAFLDEFCGVNERGRTP